MIHKLLFLWSLKAVLLVEPGASLTLRVYGTGEAGSSSTEPYRAPLRHNSKRSDVDKGSTDRVVFPGRHGNAICGIAYRVSLSVF